ANAELVLIFDAGAVKDAADNVIANAGKIADSAAADEDDRVFLKIVADAGNVGSDLAAIREAHAGDLSQGGVGLLGGHRLDDKADAALLRRDLKVFRLALARFGTARGLTQLIDGWHAVLKSRCEIGVAPYLQSSVSGARNPRTRLNFLLLVRERILE